MRGTPEHVEPSGTQPCPDDNTWPYVRAQVREYTSSGTLVHSQVAREIAAYWQSLSAHRMRGGPTSNNALAAFAGSGKIERELLHDIERERLVGPPDSDVTATFSALTAYVRAVPVVVYSVGKNIAGYSPEADVDRFLDWSDAVERYKDMLRDEAADDITRDPDGECDCDPDGGEGCEWHVVEALVAGHIRDDVDSRTEPGPLGVVIRADSWAGSMSYWLAMAATAFGRFDDETKEH